MSMAGLFFGADCRLLQAAEFQQVFSQTLCKVHQPTFLLLATRSTASPRLGLVIAKRKIRRSHERNRVKRLARESFRHHRHQLPKLDVVLMAKPEAQFASNADLHAQLDLAWAQLARRAVKQGLDAVPATTIQGK